MGYGDLSCYGHPVIRSPHLDRLASQGIRLTDYYSAAPVCSPSRAGLLTGRIPSRAGIYDWIPAGHVMQLAKDEVTIASLLKSAGYATCHAGKWHLNGKFNSAEQAQPGDHGFDHWFSTQNNAAPSHRNPNNFVRNGKNVGPLEGFSCQLVVNEALKWLDSVKKDQPYFLFVCFHEPHEPVDSPPELVKTYSNAKEPDQAQYFANVTNMDAAVGRLIEALDKRDRTDGVDNAEGNNTLIWFTSDNGPETLNRYRGANRSWGSPGPLRGMKLHLHEGGIRVPGIMRWTGRVKPGQVVSTPVCGLDALPTVCELAGVKLPARTFDGTSVVPLIDAKSVQRDRPLMWFYDRALGGRQFALRDGDLKILGHLESPDKKVTRGGVNQAQVEWMRSAKLIADELFDLSSDCAEKQPFDFAAREKQARLEARFQSAFGEVQKSLRDLSTKSK